MSYCIKFERILILSLNFHFIFCSTDKCYTQKKFVLRKGNLICIYWILELNLNEEGEKKYNATGLRTLIEWSIGFC